MSWMQPMPTSLLQTSSWRRRFPLLQAKFFLITNDESWPFWTFANGIFDRLDVAFPGKRVKKKPFVIPKSVAMVMAGLTELIAWLTGKEPNFTRFKVVFTCTSRWHRIDKAKNTLGYKPRVSMNEGLDLTVAVSSRFLLLWEKFLLTRTFSSGGLSRLRVGALLDNSSAACSWPCRRGS